MQKYVFLADNVIFDRIDDRDLIGNLIGNFFERSGLERKVKKLYRVHLEEETPQKLSKKRILLLRAFTIELNI